MKFTMYPDPWQNVVEELIVAGHEWVEDLQEAQFLIFNGGPRSVPQLPESIGFVQFVYTGIDGLLRHNAIKPGVRWANAAGVFARPVAETGMALLLSALHNYKAIGQAGTFSIRAEADARQSWLFHNHTVAIVGAGGIGREMISMLKPFDCRILAVNRSGREVPGVDEVYTFDRLDEVWPQADSVVLIAPLTEQTHHMVGAQELAAMKSSAVLVNIGRGKLVDTNALVEALRSGVIAGAAMDVVDPEPLPDAHPLYRLPNALVSPHIAATARVSQILIGPQIIKNAAAFERGERMPTEVDVEAGY